MNQVDAIVPYANRLYQMLSPIRSMNRDELLQLLDACRIAVRSSQPPFIAYAAELVEREIHVQLITRTGLPPE